MFAIPKFPTVLKILINSLKELTFIERSHVYYEVQIALCISYKNRHLNSSISVMKVRLVSIQMHESNLPCHSFPCAHLLNILCTSDACTNSTMLNLTRLLSKLHIGLDFIQYFTFADLEICNYNVANILLLAILTIVKNKKD